MPPIRQSDRVRKPKVHWEPPPPTRRRQSSAIIIYTDPSEDLSPEDLVMQPPKDLDSQPKDLDSQFKDLDLQLEEDLDMHSLKDLDLQLKNLVTQPVKNSSYQSQFLSKVRAGRPQNMSENIMPVKLFQLFFTVKEIENIVKQTNQQAIYIDFKSF